MRAAAVILLFIGMALCVVMVVLGVGCHVYEAPCGRAHPGGGVTVRYAELADDGGSE